MTPCFSATDFGTFCQVLGPVSDFSVTIFHVNIRSVRKHWDEFRALINDLTPPADVFVLTEINISALQCNQFTL